MCHAHAHQHNLVASLSLLPTVVRVVECFAHVCLRCVLCVDHTHTTHPHRSRLSSRRAAPSTLSCALTTLLRRRERRRAAMPRVRLYMVGSLVGWLCESVSLSAVLTSWEPLGSTSTAPCAIGCSVNPSQTLLHCWLFSHMAGAGDTTSGSLSQPQQDKEGSEGVTTAAPNEPASADASSSAPPATAAAAPCQEPAGEEGSQQATSAPQQGQQQAAPPAAAEADNAAAGSSSTTPGDDNAAAGMAAAGSDAARKPRQKLPVEVSKRVAYNVCACMCVSWCFHQAVRNSSSWHVLCCCDAVLALAVDQR